MHRSMLLALAPMKDVTDLAFLNTLKDLNSLPGLCTPHINICSSTRKTCLG